MQVFDEEMLMQVTPDSAAEDAVFNMVFDDAGSKRIRWWLREQKLNDKVQVGVVAVRMMIGNQTIARAKVVSIYRDPITFAVEHRGGFYHEEPYDDFPSDHFKTKILLVTGGA